MKIWSKSWKSSKSPRKQRKYRYNAPVHLKRKLVSSHLSKELRQKYGTRSVVCIEGDKVKVVRGQYKGHVGKIDRIVTRKTKVIISGIEVNKKDGSKTVYPIDPSNVIITELNLTDKKRASGLDKTKPKKKE